MRGGRHALNCPIFHFPFLLHRTIITKSVSFKESCHWLATLLSFPRVYDELFCLHLILPVVN